MTIDELFEQRKNIPSDINEHMPFLRLIAMKCSHITEFGVRSGNSTIALASSKPKKMVSYDINLPPNDLISTIKSEVLFYFHQADVNYIDIEETDLLFIDTYHSYSQLKNELKLHAKRVRQYIILHDTEIFGTRGEDGNEPGLRAAVKDALDSKVWKVCQDFKNNNGLMIIERIVKQLPIDEHPFIETVIPYEPCHNFGRALNRIMERSYDWVLILDHDIYLCNPNWYEACLSVIQRVGKKAGFITCKTNRSACGLQRCGDAPASEDLLDHIAYAKKLWKASGTEFDRYPGGVGANGYFMLTHKKAWDDAGRFPLRFHVDCDFEAAVTKAGYETVIMKGVYVYHLEKKKADCQGDWAIWKNYGTEWRIL